MVSKPKSCSLRKAGGFTLVELMVVVGIVAILATVATPAYINYVNRSKQGEAASGLFTARLEMEEFLTDNGHYASTIQCLPSFAKGSTLCASNSAKPKYYTFSVAAGASTTYYRIQAARTINGLTDSLTISANTDTPIIQNTDALKFSVFKWLFQ